ncbi:MAG TPA: hypothetical protein VES59_09150 [Bacteroidota bacterium]|nr:hypothetical protein [Bacteroidota bacterium]
MKRFVQRSIGAGFLLAGSQSFLVAQETQRFGTKGTREIGGSIAFQSWTPVYDGQTGNGRYGSNLLMVSASLTAWF